MAVGVQADEYVRVAQKLLHEVGILARHEEYCSAGVPEIVQLDSGQLRPLEERLEVTTQEARRPHGRARRGWYHEPVILQEGAHLTRRWIMLRA
jgi:hypothetical protein